MKTITISLGITMLLASALFAQQSLDIRTVGQDSLAVLNGDTERFDRGMQGLEALMAKSPNDPKLKVLHGNGVFARSGAAFEKGDIQNAMKLWQSALDEMNDAVQSAP